jgi:Na+/proline symporter
MIFGIIAVIFAVTQNYGGLNEALKELSKVTDPAVSDTPGIFTSFFGPDPAGLLGVVLLTSLGTWGLPQMVQKFYAIKSEKAISKGMIISTIFALVVAGGCYFLGGFGRLVFPSTEAMQAAGNYDAIIPQMLSGLSPVLVGVVVVLVLSASMSTLSSLVMTSSSTLALDFIKGTVVKDLSEKKQLLIIRILIAVFIAISVAIAIIQHNQGLAFIAQLMGISWGALAGAFLGPFLYGLYWKRTSKAAVWVCLVFSSVVMLGNILVNSWFPPLLRHPINAGVFCMLAGLVIVPAVSLLTKPPKKEHIEQVFSCYDKKVMVSAKDAIGDPIYKEEIQ